MYFIYFLHLFNTTGHLFYITDLKVLFLRFKYRITRINGERKDIVKLITCPLIKLQFFFRIKERYIKYEMHKREEKGKYTKKYKTYEGRCGDD